MTLTDAEVVQPTRDLHHQVRDTILGQAQGFLDNPTAFDTGDHVLDLDAHTGDHLVQELVSPAEFLAPRLFFGWRVSTPAGS